MMLTLGILWLGSDLVLLGKLSVLLAGDNGEIIIPGLLRYRYADAIRPLWDNFAAAGSDRESLGFNLFLDVWLFRHLPGWVANTIRIGSQVLVPTLAVYALARRTFNFLPWTAVFCALVYVLLIEPGWLINATFAYYPLLVLAATLVLEKKTAARRWLLLAASVALLVGTGYFSRIFPFAPLALVAWFLFVDLRRTASDWLVIAATAAAIFLLSINTILALKTQAPLSHLSLVRFQPTAGQVFQELLDHPWFFSSVVNITCVILFAYGVVASRAAAPRIKGLVALFVLGTLAPIVAVAAQVALLPVIKFLYGFNMTRLWQIPAVALPFAAGYGFERLLGGAGDPDRRRRLFYRAACAAAAAALAFFSLETKWMGAKDWISQGTYVHNFESPVLKDLAARIRAEPLPVRAESFQLYPTYLHGYGIETAGGYQPLFLRRYYEYYGKMMEPWLAGLDPASHELWGEYAKRLAAAAGGAAYRGERLMLIPHDHQPERRLTDLYRLNMLSLANVGYIVSRDRFIDDALEPIREAPKPWSALTTWEKIKINARANFLGRGHLYIYRNHDVLPRFFSTAGLRIFPDGPATLDAVARATPQELRESAFMEASALPAGLTPDGVFRPLSIRLERYESDIIVLRVEGGPGFLVATNSYSPYWRCTENGQPIPLAPVYHAFWGMRIGDAASTIICRYRPPTLF